MAADESPLARAARDYIARGIAVIPLGEGKKEPVTKHGLNDWSDNPDQVGVWWGRGRRYNVGGVLGQVSGGIIAIDLDVHSDESDGIRALRAWEVEHGELPETWMQVTGSGGRQMFYRASREVRNSANGALGVDIRGDGGYVVLPPSLHPCGETYEWSVSPNDMDVADANDQVYAFIEYARPRHDTASRERFDLPSDVAENRNDTLFRYGSSLRSANRSDAEIRAMLSAANETRCRPPLAPTEVEKIAASVCRYEPGNALSTISGGGEAEPPQVSGERPAKKMADETTEKIQNVLLAHETLREGIKCNRLDGKLHVLTDCIPETGFDGPHVLTDAETAKMFTYLEHDFGVRSYARFQTALLAFAGTRSQQYDPIAEALRALPTVRPVDGQSMADGPAKVEVSEDGGRTWERRESARGRLLPYYMGCELTEYVHEAEMLTNRQLVARALWPGCKADVMPILVGPQGIGKSTFVAALALDRDFFLEGFSTFGDEDIKRIVGRLAVEIPELDSFSKKDMNLIKSVITRQVDTYREAYARSPLSHPRTAIFFGTTNDSAFLTDSTGNRRFLPIECGRDMNDADPGLFDGTLDHDAAQWWGEGVAEAGEVGKDAFLRSLTLPRRVLAESVEMQERFTQEDHVQEVVSDYLGELGPENRYVNVKMVMFEAMGYDKRAFTNEKRFFVNNVANAIGRCPGWKETSSKQRVPGYGISKAWERFV
jgi:hypothetical protein